jgi:hypothetical protein
VPQDILEMLRKKAASNIVLAVFVLWKLKIVKGREKFVRTNPFRLAT